MANSLNILGKQVLKPLKPQNTLKGYPLEPSAYIYVVINLNTKGKPFETPLKNYAIIEL